MFVYIFFMFLQFYNCFKTKNFNFLHLKSLTSLRNPESFHCPGFETQSALSGLQNPKSVHFLGLLPVKGSFSGFPILSFSRISPKNLGQNCIIFTFYVLKPESVNFLGFSIGKVFISWVAKPGRCSLSVF